MTLISKNIFIVNCDKNTFEDSFSRKRNSDIINYHEIRKRLTNNDVFKSPPSQDIIEFQIVKKLNSFIKCKKTEFLYFYIEDLGMSFISNLKIIFNDCEFPVNFHLLVKDNVEFLSIHNEFNSVQILDK